MHPRPGLLHCCMPYSILARNIALVRQAYRSLWQRARQSLHWLSGRYRCSRKSLPLHHDWMRLSSPTLALGSWLSSVIMTNELQPCSNVLLAAMHCRPAQSPYDAVPSLPGLLHDVVRSAARRVALMHEAAVDMVTEAAAVLFIQELGRLPGYERSAHVP